METHEIDASNKVLGRLATEIARLLMGKDRIDYAPHRIPGVRVVITHAEKIEFSGRKFAQKRYFRHSGFPGGAKFMSLGQAFSRDPRRVLQHAVAGMLPKNRLRAQMLKRLAVYRAAAPN